jgi:hypothetical protein
LHYRERSYWMPGSYGTSNAMSAGSHAFPRVRPVGTHAQTPRDSGWVA